MIVCKFGGTSVADAEAIARTRDIIASKRDRQPVVVVSALGGATNQLLEVANRAASGELLLALVSQIAAANRADEHAEIVRAINALSDADKPLAGELVRAFVAKLQPTAREKVVGLATGTAGATATCGS